MSVAFSGNRFLYLHLMRVVAQSGTPRIHFVYSIFLCFLRALHWAELARSDIHLHIRFATCDEVYATEPDHHVSHVASGDHSETATEHLATVLCDSMSPVRH